MFIKPKSFLRALLFISMIVLWSSCTKKPVCPEPVASSKNLWIELDKSYMPASQVDSAVAIWEVNGQQTQITLSTSSDSLLADITKFQQGTGTLTIQVFSKLKFGFSYSSLWVFTKQVTIKHDSAFEIDGPKSFSDQYWKPRVLLKDAIGHFAIVALRPDDSYFFVKDLPDNLRSVIVAREYWKTGGGVSQIGGGEWECSLNCKNENGHVENTQFFAFLPTQIGTKAWNHIEISVLYVEDKWGGGSVLSMNHTL